MIVVDGFTSSSVSSGEGGALLINDEKFIKRAEIIREKGTNRNQFFRGEVDKYTWNDVGSSYLPGEIIAAFLYAQLQQSSIINKNRLESWHFYHENLESLEKIGLLKRPTIPKDCRHNAHIYYVLINEKFSRQSIGIDW